MNKNCVQAMVLWLQRSGILTYECQRITLYNFFKISMFQYYGYWNELLLQNDMANFGKNGVVPPYVIVFMRNIIYQRLLCSNPNPTPSLLV